MVRAVRRVSAAVVSAAGVAALVIGLAYGQPVEGGASRPADVACAATATWLEPATRRTVTTNTLIGRAAAADIVLLGEVHDDPDHHRWQLQTTVAIHERHPEMVIGVEMLPRRAQGALDRWVAGGLSEAAFLDAVRWTETWGFDPSLYMPLFHFARLHRIPMVALNVERKLVSRVARTGWATIPADEREGLGDPAPPVEAYRLSLAGVFDMIPHGAGSGGHASAAPAHAASGDGGLRAARFTEAQVTWDRAMAEAIDGARSTHPGAVVVAIAGRGHLVHRWGIPHQLDDLGAPPAMVLLAVAEAEACAVAADLADAVFILPPPAGD